MQLLADKIMGVESGGNPYAKNSRSSATGAGQFINSTWLSMMAKHRPDIKGTPEELLAMRTNPQLSGEMTNAYAADNGAILKAAGHEATPGNTYLAHFAGPQGAASLLSADPSTPAAAIMGPQAMAANPFLRGKTAGDVVKWAANKIMGTQPAPQGVPQAPAAPVPAQPQEQPQQAPQAAQPPQQAPPAYHDAPITHAQFQPLAQPQMPSLMGTMQPMKPMDMNSLLAALQSQSFG